jgi:hypothetical protein
MLIRTSLYDLRLTLRHAGRAKAFYASAVLTLALGIAGAHAISMSVRQILKSREIICVVPMRARRRRSRPASTTTSRRSPQPRFCRRTRTPPSTSIANRRPG